MRIFIVALVILAAIAAAPLLVSAHGGKDDSGNTSKVATPVATLDPEECGPGEPESPSEPTCTPAPTSRAATPTPTSKPAAEAASATPAPPAVGSSTVTPEVLGAQHGPTDVQPAALPETGGRP